MPIGFEVSMLLEAVVVDRKDLCECFISYDTTYGVDGEKYPAPTGKLILMLLKTRDSGELWTTIRRCYTEKLSYYRGLRGHFVNCVVNEKKRVNKRLW
jgi:hypothetical protein